MKKLIVMLCLTLVLSFTLSLFVVAEAQPRIHGGGSAYANNSTPADFQARSPGPGNWSPIAFCSLRGQWWHLSGVPDMSSSFTVTRAITANTWSLASATNGNGFTVRGAWAMTFAESTAQNRYPTWRGNTANWQLTN